MDPEEDMLHDAVESSNGSSPGGVDSDGKSSGADLPMECESPTEDPFEVLSSEEVVQLMIDTINEINRVVEIPAATIRILLNHFRWDKEELMERFFDGDQEKLFAEAHVINPFARRSQISLPKLDSGPNHTEECGICFLTLPTSMLTGLECDHRFCTDCWDEYLNTKIMKQGKCQTIACAAHGCDILVDDVSVMKLIKDPKVKLKYQHLITNSFVECNRQLRWCPSLGCSNAIKVQYAVTNSVTCKCGHKFCFQCGEECHDPVECHLLRKWKKDNGDVEASVWIHANTKECPRCHVPIEKRGGCNVIHCIKPSCGAYFCWLCMFVWTPTNVGQRHACNQWSAVKTANNALERSKTAKNARERHFFYLNRYTNHMKSLKFEGELYAKVESKMEEMQKLGIPWLEVQYLKKAVDLLCSCRKTLMYSYVFAYYLRQGNQSAIFEANQMDLEGATEWLSEYLERDITDEDLLAIKQKVQDKYNYCDSRRKRLLEHVQDGVDKALWEFMD